MARIGILGGSGLYAMEGFEGEDEVYLPTPFGEPSDAYVTGTLEGVPVVFLPRHGRGHRVNPSEVNYRANMWGLKKLGCDVVISVSVVGSMKEEIRPGDLVLIDQLIDRTKARPSTFYDRGIACHAPFAEPFFAPLRDDLAAAAKTLDGVTCHVGGTYVCIEGPQFSTRAESLLYRSWGVSVIGMTNLQEAKLAREAELCFQTVALATDYDCWYEGEADVTVEEVIKIVQGNIAKAKALLRAAVPRVAASAWRNLPAGPDRKCPARDALKGSIMTSPEAITPETRARVDLLVGRYL